MTHKITMKERILGLLSDGKIHCSSEFRDFLGALEYRRRLTELRRDGYEIESLSVEINGHRRPAYQMKVNF